MNVKIRGLTMLALTSLLVMGSHLVAASDSCGGVSCDNDGSGTNISLKKQLNLNAGSAGAGPSGQKWVYGISPYCAGIAPTEPGGAECTLMDVFCQDKPGSGPAVWIFQRRIEPGSPWYQLGYSCYPDVMPDKVTMDTIQRAFHATDFSIPGVEVQPKGNRTLVRLDNFFHILFPKQGFQPNEVDSLDPAEWYGMQVHIRPTLESATLNLGDGRTLGPSPSLGGTYPDGDLRAAYDDFGSFEISANITYQGEVMIDGSEWIEIPGTVSLDGEATTLTVLTAKNRLYAPGA